ncbi:MAG: cohesin domain-containing protein [Dehalococcoidia bacterium]
MYVKRLVIIACTVSLLLAAPRAGRAAGSAQLAFAPSASSANAGATVALDITVADVTGLGGYDLQLSFDPAVVHLSSLQDSGFVTSSGNLVTCVPAQIDNNAGHAVATCFTIPLFSTSSGAATVAPVALMHASFVAMTPGISTLSLAGSDLKNAASAPIPVALASGTVAVASAPAAGASPTGVAPSVTPPAPAASPTGGPTQAATPPGTGSADASATPAPSIAATGASAAVTVAASVLGVPATGSAGGGHRDTAAIVAVLVALAAASIGGGVLVVLRNRRAGV